MKNSIEILKRELAFINERIRLLRGGSVRINRGITLKLALEMKKDFDLAIKLLEDNQ